MPPDSNIIQGTVRKGIYEGYAEVDKIISTGGQTVDLYISDGVELAVSLTVTIKHSTGNLTAITNSNGQYSINLANLTSYELGDTITISVDTRAVNTETQESRHGGANAQKIIPVDRLGKAFDEAYPFPVVLANKLSGHPDVFGNVKTTWAISRNDGQPDSETVTFPDGESHTRTFEYNVNGFLVMRGRWVKD